MVFTFLCVQQCSSEVGGFRGERCSPRRYCQESLFSLGVNSVLRNPAVPELAGILLAFQVEPGVQPLGPASEGHENFPPKNAVTDQESSHQIQQLVSCEPGLG